jgi:hypothetical protein
MNLVLLALGVLATAAGFVMVGFGIPINAFSLGNTLIISGTIAVGCGFILIGMAAAIGQLRRIGEALDGRSPSLRMGRSESIESLLPQTARITPATPPPLVPTRMPAPPKPVDVPEAYAPEPAYHPEPGLHPEPRPVVQHPPEQRAPEPRFPATAAGEPPGPLDWLRSKSRPTGPMPAAEPPMVEVPDEVPLSPRPPHRPAVPAEPALEPKVWSPGRSNGQSEARPLPRATPQPEPPREKESGPFDAVWPERAAAPSMEPRREARPEAPVPHPVAPRPDRPIERRPETAGKPASERAPTILKSGVIDGMPYTLYADGSIEAELPQGTVKFASVDALRAHLEKHG